MSTNPVKRAEDGWSAKSVGTAVVATVALVLLFQLLGDLGIGTGLTWEPLIVPSLGGAIVLGVRHRGTWLLSLLLYFPSMLFVLYWTAFLMAVSRGDGP